MTSSEHEDVRENLWQELCNAVRTAERLVGSTSMLTDVHDGDGGGRSRSRSGLGSARDLGGLCLRMWSNVEKTARVI